MRIVYNEGAFLAARYANVKRREKKKIRGERGDFAKGETAGGFKGYPVYHPCYRTRAPARCIAVSVVDCGNGCALSSSRHERTRARACELTRAQRFFARYRDRARSRSEYRLEIRRPFRVDGPRPSRDKRVSVFGNSSRLPRAPYPPPYIALSLAASNADASSLTWRLAFDPSES